MNARSLSKNHRAAKSQKPDKPYADFPLTAHASGRWCKKVRGKIHYFGTWGDANAALQEWLEVRDVLLGGADPKRNDERADVARLCNTFLDSKDQQREQGDLSLRTLNDYHDACKRFADFIGKGRLLDGLTVADFARYRSSFPKTWGRRASTVR